jgi:hypothetical protein
VKIRADERGKPARRSGAFVVRLDPAVPHGDFAPGTSGRSERHGKWRLTGRREHERIRDEARFDERKARMGSLRDEGTGGIDEHPLAIEDAGGAGFRAQAALGDARAREADSPAALDRVDIERRNTRVGHRVLRR